MRNMVQATNLERKYSSCRYRYWFCLQLTLCVLYVYGWNKKNLFDVFRTTFFTHTFIFIVNFTSSHKRTFLENDDKQLLWRVNRTQPRDPSSITFVCLVEKSTSKNLATIQSVFLENKLPWSMCRTRSHEIWSIRRFPAEVTLTKRHIRFSRVLRTIIIVRYALSLSLLKSIIVIRETLNKRKPRVRSIS